MKIISLHIDGFGKLRDQDMEFQDGLNIVYGKNEAGKSTIHTFIKGMLFGIDRQRGRAARNDTYSKYVPWQNSGTYEGWMRLESEGQIYRIQRRFQKNNKELTIINETLGKEETPTKALLDQLRCGLSETVYENTISIGQLKCATEGGMVSELRNYIANLNTSGSMALNITKATEYLKSQRKELEKQLVPEAARSYTALLGEIRKIEQEISSPQYANQLPEYRVKKSQVKQQLESRQNEKEGLLEKAAKGRQILEGSQFTDQESVQSYVNETKQLYREYENAAQTCARKSPVMCAVLMFLLAALSGTGAVLLLFAPQLINSLSLPVPAPAAAGALGTAAVIAFVIAIAALNKRVSYKKKLDTSARLLQEIFARHLGDSSISDKAMNNLEARMTEFLRLSKAVTQSEDTLAKITGEIQTLQASQELFGEEMEQQQRIQWELEKKLEYLADCKNRADSLRKVQTENQRIQEELDAIDLAQDTMTALSTTIRDSFGLYLNKAASELIGGITGGIYTSMSIDENLDVFMNTPGKLVSIDQVSSGTMDQIYLAVRLAAARLVQDGRDRMPLIFDDSFVLYDEDRLKTALKWLAKTYDNQIIIFTCHQREAQLLTANQVKYNLIAI